MTTAPATAPYPSARVPSPAGPLWRWSPDVPAWVRVRRPGSPRGRRPSAAGRGAGRLPSLLAAGFGISRPRHDAAGRRRHPAAGPAPVSRRPRPLGRGAGRRRRQGLLPTVVEIRHGSGVGFGFVYDKNGYIMTAAHVIDGVEEVEVRLYDGTSSRARASHRRPELRRRGKVDRTGLATASLAVARPPGRPAGDRHRQPLRPQRDRHRRDHPPPTGVLDDGREVIQTTPRSTRATPAGCSPTAGAASSHQQRHPPGRRGLQRNVGIGSPSRSTCRPPRPRHRPGKRPDRYLGVRPSLTTTGGIRALIQGHPYARPPRPAPAGDLVTSIDGQEVQNYSEIVARIRPQAAQGPLGVSRGGTKPPLRPP